MRLIGRYLRFLDGVMMLMDFLNELVRPVRNFIFGNKNASTTKSDKKKASQFNWDAFNTQMKPELRYSFRLG